jgi:signal transduction histidine kinase/ligand-binding sensor domain-containing protein/DNA-binding response OmpR family regulator
MFLRFFILIIAFLLSANLFSQSIYFNHLTTQDGLSNNNVYDVIQDRLGFLWFATEDGLNRFDGYDFKVFRNDSDNQNSISDNSVWVLKEDRKGFIWIGTKNGWLNFYDPVSDKFRKWKIESDVQKENAITYIYEDSKGLIWVGTYRSGLYRLNPSNNTIDHWYNNLDDKSSISNNYISSILEDKEGNIWISTYNGLNKLDPNSSLKAFKRFFNIPGNPNSLSNNIVWYLTKSDSDPNVIWIGTANGLTKYLTDQKSFSQITIPNPQGLQFGTAGGSVVEEISGDEKILWIDSYAGLIRLNTINGSVNRFNQDKDNPNSLASNQIHRIMKDRSGVLWLATEKGLSFFSLKSTKFNYSFSNHFSFNNPSEFDKKNIKAITETSDGKIWFGTEKGLYFTQINNGNITIKKHLHSRELNIWSLTPGGSSDLWIGTYGSGLYQLDLNTDKLKAIPNYEKKSRSPAVKYVKSICIDKDDNLWIGFWGMGLARLNPFDENYKGWLNDKSDTSSLSFDDVWAIHQDKKGRIWIGTDGGGLNFFNETDGGRFYRWTAVASGQGNLSSRGVYSICEAQAKSNSEDVTVLWIGTNNGLNKFVVRNSESQKEFSSPPKVDITNFTIEHGLADNSVKSIVEDDNGNLWLGTGSGISFFDTDKNIFTNFSKTDGVIGSDFNFSAAYKNEDGIIFMGSTEGLNYFFPSDIKLSTFMPPLLITDFQIFNKSVEINDDSPLKSSIFQTEKIILSYTQNVFSFQFAALDYTSPQKIKYAYKMEGFDNDWVNSGSRRFVTYTNLNPGEYNLKVKSTNSDGVWNENFSQLKVVITPPWWQTTYAIGLYALIFMLGVWGIIKFQSYRTRLQQELKMQEFEAHHLREIESMKSRFFANLSHEFRTPLTLIKGPLEQLISGRIKENLKDYYKMLLRNTEKLQNLIDQLLELSQLEAESIPLNKKRNELVSLLRGFTYSFIPLAEQKFISLSYNSSVDRLYVLIDRDKLEKIINNLLNNAFKFTSTGGKISIDLTIEKGKVNEMALVSVSDTGIGIPEEYQSKIFDRFFQMDDDSGNQSLREKSIQTGSGIGLALVKELATLHKWDISVQSMEGVGTVFTLKIPLEKTIDIEKENVVTPDSEIKIEKEEYVSDYIDGETGEDDNSNKKFSSEPVILFVEDSPDVRSYVYDLLKQDYKVLLAEKAEDGIELALKNTPSLILSDIMMPGMDGIEFCHRIKSDWQTSHIPVILLTAKATSDSKIEGLETGADDYVTKPFNYDELSARIKNLIEQRKHLREKFSKEINIKAESISSNAVDKEFVQKIIDIIEKNLGNEKFESTMLSESLFVSRSQLNRKLHAVTGQGPGEFIRIYKLKRAAQMIVENRLSITQIAYEVGFGSPAQFTRSFKKYFNCLPSDFTGNVTSV